MALNRLRLHSVLVQNMDAPSSSAEKLADLVDESTDDLVTKHDLALAQAEILTSFHEEMNRMLKWMIGLGLIVGGGLIGLLAALVAKL